MHTYIPTALYPYRAPKASNDQHLLQVHSQKQCRESAIVEIPLSFLQLFHFISLSSCIYFASYPYRPAFLSRHTPLVLHLFHFVSLSSCISFASLSRHIHIVQSEHEHENEHGNKHENENENESEISGFRDFLDFEDFRIFRILGFWAPGGILGDGAPRGISCT